MGKATLHIGAIAFIHRFGANLNEHAHFHVCAVDGIFEEMVGYLWTSRKRVFVSVRKRCLAGPRSAPYPTFKPCLSGCHRQAKSPLIFRRKVGGGPWFQATTEPFIEVRPRNALARGICRRVSVTTG